MDKEFAVIQSEWYAEPQAATESPMAHGRVSGGAAATAKPADPLQDPDLLGACQPVLAAHVKFASGRFCLVCTLV